MGWLEIVLLCVVAVWLILTLIWLVRRRGKTCGACGSCNACEYRKNCTENKRE